MTGEKKRFHNPELQAAYESVEPLLNAFTKRLDDISRDIKQVEETIGAFGVCIELSNGSLYWKQIDQGDRKVWRLCLKREFKNLETTVFIPFIQAKAEERLKHHGELTGLLKKLQDLQNGDIETRSTWWGEY